MGKNQKKILSGMDALFYKSPKIKGKTKGNISSVAFDELFLKNLKSFLRTNKKLMTSSKIKVDTPRGSDFEALKGKLGIATYFKTSTCRGFLYLPQEFSLKMISLFLGESKDYGESLNSTKDFSEVELKLMKPFCEGIIKCFITALTFTLSDQSVMNLLVVENPRNMVELLQVKEQKIQGKLKENSFFFELNDKNYTGFIYNK